MSKAMKNSRFTGVRMELTLLTEKVVDGHRIDSEQDLFKVDCIERVLGGTFATIH